MKKTYITITFNAADASIHEHVKDTETGEDTHAYGIDALEQLRTFLTGCYVDAVVMEDGSVSLGIVSDATASKPKSGRPKKSEGWPEGLDTDAERLAWLESVSVKEATETLGVSRRTYYRRLEELRATVS